MSVKSRRHYDIERNVRDKIEIIKIINRLQNHILNGDEMMPTQISAAAILLKKTLPDLSESQVTTIKREATDYSRAELLAILDRADAEDGSAGISPPAEGGREPDSVH